MTFRKKHPFKRSNAGQYVAGKWVPGAIETVMIDAGIQPVSGQGGELSVNLPEGKRTQDTIRVYTDEPIFEAQEKKGIEADRLTYRGDEYECLSVEEWQSGVISHFKGYFVKVS